MSVLESVLADLGAEGDQLRTAVTAGGAEVWETPTPAPGWTVATQIAHLVWTDEVSVLATRAGTDAGKREWDDVVLKAIEDPTGFVDKAAAEIAAASPGEGLLERWDASRGNLAAALRGVPDGQKIPWFGPPMSPASMATARFMETWAHALDVYDALDSTPEQTDRIKHVAHIGVRTRDFAFGQHRLTPPSEPFRVELVSPSGEPWEWGPVEATQRIEGSAIDFCRLVTQRVHHCDTDLVATGSDAEKWLTIAQCFAGAPGPGREPREDR